MNEIVIDCFAGGGGASTGIEAALGRAIDVAINHSPEAICMHRANHPGTLHFLEDIRDIDPRRATKGRPVGLAWFSPDCTFHSKARGGKPFRDRNRARRIRGLAWIVVRWAEAVRPRVIMLENVEEFADWGPLTDDGKPCPLRRGQTFQRWVKRLVNLGYEVDMRELRACDYGSPTIRKRLYIIARCDGQPIVWPEPTHGRGLLPYRTAAECIDWSIPCPSIFERKRPLAENTLRRIARGIQRYVIDAAEPFIVPVAHAGDDRSHGVDEPFRTVTGAHRGEHALVTPFMAPRHNDDRDGRQPRTASVDAPQATITARDNAVLVTPFLTEHANSGNQRNMPADDPLRTQCAQVKGGHFALVAPYLTPRYGERPPEWRCVHCGAAHEVEPVCGCTACGHEDDLVRVGGQEPRSRSVEQPMPTIVPTENGAQLVAAHLVTNTTGHPGAPADGPVPTLTTGNHQALVSAFLAQHNTGMTGHDARDPVSTIVQKGCTQALVTSNLVKLTGGFGDHKNTDQPVDVPLHTIRAGGTHFAEVRAFLINYYSNGSGKTGAQVNRPAPTIPTKDRIGLVTIHGIDYQIVDIGMRMLTPRELFNAQGFPGGYIIDPEFNGKPLTKTMQVRMCGNSVCPQVAAALVRANVAELAEAAAA